MRRVKVQTQAYESKVPVGSHGKCSLPTKQDMGSLPCLQEMPSHKVYSTNKLGASYSHMHPGLISRTQRYLYSEWSVCSSSFSCLCALFLMSMVHLYKVSHPRWAGERKQECTMKCIKSPGGYPQYQAGAPNPYLLPDTVASISYAQP